MTPEEEILSLTRYAGSIARRLRAEEARNHACVALARRLVHLDDPTYPPGVEDRRTVTLSQLVAQARAALTADGVTIIESGVTLPGETLSRVHRALVNDLVLNVYVESGVATVMIQRPLGEIFEDGHETVGLGQDVSLERALDQALRCVEEVSHDG